MVSISSTGDVILMQCHQAFEGLKWIPYNSNDFICFKVQVILTCQPRHNCPELMSWTPHILPMESLIVKRETNTHVTHSLKMSHGTHDWNKCAMGRKMWCGAPLPPFFHPLCTVRAPCCVPVPIRCSAYITYHGSPDHRVSNAALLMTASTRVNSALIFLDQQD